MSKKFKKSLQEKYGSKGLKGRVGELFFKDYYTSKGYVVYDKHNDAVLQISGVDFVIDSNHPQGFFTVDVKNNIVVKDNCIQVVVEMNPYGWLFHPKKISDFISHVNPEHGIIVTYRRRKMQHFINSNYWDFRSSIIYLPTNILPFSKIEHTYKEL